MIILFPRSPPLGRHNVANRAGGVLQPQHGCGKLLFALWAREEWCREPATRRTREAQPKWIPWRVGAAKVCQDHVHACGMAVLTLPMREK
jgi:hypothetical protein